MPIIRKSVFASLIIKRFPINQERTSFSDALFNHRDSVNLRMDRTRSEGEVNLGIVSITMDGREVLRNNVKEAVDVESK